jgi:hypothetical protein
VPLDLAGVWSKAAAVSVGFTYTYGTGQLQLCSRVRRANFVHKAAAPYICSAALPRAPRVLCAARLSSHQAQAGELEAPTGCALCAACDDGDCGGPAAVPGRGQGLFRLQAAGQPWLERGRRAGESPHASRLAHMPQPQVAQPANSALLLACRAPSARGSPST